MNIGFDAKRFFNNFTGLGNYSRFVVGALSEYAPANSYFLYSPKIKKHPEINTILERDNVNVVTPPRGYRFFGLTSIWRTWGISKESSVKTLRVFHGLSQELPVSLPASTKKVVTVHDLIYVRYPELYNPIDVSIYKRKVKAACYQADKILATSNQTKQDVIDFLKINPAKVEVVYQGCHPTFKRKISTEHIQEIKIKYALPQRYVLSVGTIEERKNVLLLVKALALFSNASRPHIVIIGRPTEYKKKVLEEVQRSGLDKWVIFLHHVSFVDLPGIYQGADLFVYPSFFEGFGIPIVEALESSVPVIAATGSCLSEAGGPGSIYVSPHNVEALAEQMQKVLSDDVLQKQMTNAGKKYIEQFEAEVIAERLIGVYKNV